MDIHDFVPRIEQLEQESVAAVEEKNRLKTREEHLKSAINQLRDDVSLLDTLSSTENSLDKELEESERTIHEYRSQVEDLENELQDYLEDLSDSNSVIQQLQELGEDVSASLSILEARYQLLAMCRKELEELENRLGLDINLNFSDRTFLSSDAKEKTGPRNQILATPLESISLVDNKETDSNGSETSDEDSSAEDDSNVESSFELERERTKERSISIDEDVSVDKDREERNHVLNQLKTQRQNFLDSIHVDVVPRIDKEKERLNQNRRLLERDDDFER